MVLRISGKNVDIGQALRQRIDETVSAAVHKYFNGGYSGQVTVSRSGRAFATDCTLHLDTGIVFEARASDMDPHQSFDLAFEKLDKRLRRYKRRSRITTRLKRMGSTAPLMCLQLQQTKKKSARITRRRSSPRPVSTSRPSR
jgi:ribosomal subunit interface protein